MTLLQVIHYYQDRPPDDDGPIQSMAEYERREAEAESRRRAEERAWRRR